MSDLIEELPLDNSPLSYEEEARIEPLVSPNSAGDGFLSRHKKQLISIVLFLILSLPIVDSLFKSVIGNQYLATIVKAIVFAIILYVLEKMI
jgi:hypothetical protein